MIFQTTDKNFEHFVANINDHFDASNDSIHKARNEIKVIPYNNQTLNIKSFKTPNLFNKFIYTFFKNSKAKKSYLNALKIEPFTPKPIAFVEFFKYGLLEKSYYITEHFSYDFTIREPLLDANFPQKEGIFKAFAHFTLNLHNAGIFHKDYSPGNILIKKENDDYIFKVVDINRMEFINLNTQKRAQNFAKLWAKDEDLQIITDEYAKAYQIDKESFTKLALHLSQKHKDKINFKKRMRGVEVVD